MKTRTLKYLSLFIFCMLFFNSCKSLKNNKANTLTMIVNKGVGGNSTNDLLKRIEIDVVNEKPDLVILMVGTNDMLNSKKMIPYEEYSSNLNEIVKTIKSSKSKLLMMSSPPVDSAYLFARHDKSLFTEAPNVKINTARQIVEKIAKENKAFYLNLNQAFKNKNLPKHNQDLYIKNEMNSNTKDGVHPTSLGYKFIAETIFQYLKENRLLNKYDKIICFGDSITRGSGNISVESVPQENYPSFLHTMFAN